MFNQSVLLIITGVAPNTNILSNNEITITEGNSNTITCEAIGYPPPSVTWNRNDRALSGRVSISNSVNTLTGDGNVTRVSVDLAITNAYREDTGVYICAASNFIGSDSMNIIITINCKYLHCSNLMQYT